MPTRAAPSRPITVALIDDYDVVLKGLAHMFDDYRDRIVVAEIDANAELSDQIDIVLYDSFAQPESDHQEIRQLVANPRARHTVVYTWNFHPDLVQQARDQGVRGYLSKALPARDLVACLEAVHAGDEVLSPPPRRGPCVSERHLPRRSGPASPRDGWSFAPAPR